MKTNPLVYIVLPCRNWEKYLLEQLMSIYYQSYKNRFLIFVNDGSTDSSEKIIRDWNNNYDLNKKVKILSKENWWLNSAITIWLEYIKQICNQNYNNFVCYCDADDIRIRDKLEKQVSYMLENPKYGLSYHDLFWIDENSRFTKISMISNRYNKDTSFLYFASIWNFIAATSMMFKVSFIDKILPMPQWFWMYQDYWTALIFSFFKINIWYIPVPLGYYRQGHSSLQSRKVKINQETRNISQLKYFNFLQERFPEKNLDNIIKYKNDRLINRPNKKYSLFHIYIY